MHLINQEMYILTPRVVENLMQTLSFLTQLSTYVYVVYTIITIGSKAATDKLNK